MKGIAAAVAAGLALGFVSRWIDTAAWPPDWIGYVFTPWLAAAWLVGAPSASARRGALIGLVVLLATVIAYLVSAGPNSLPAAALYGLAVLAGPIFGAAGATWRGRVRWSAVSGALLGVTVIVEGLALQLAVRSTPEHLALVGESVAGIGLAVVLVRRSRRYPVAGVRRTPLTDGQQGDPRNP